MIDDAFSVREGKLYARRVITNSVWSICDGYLSMVGSALWPVLAVVFLNVIYIMLNIKRVVPEADRLRYD